MPTTFEWQGKHEFQIAGTDHHEDTLRIKADAGHKERLARLRLPTLVITYADMKFKNAIGGEQALYPDSRRYAPFFDPPVVLTGADIEKKTWIRGAQRVIVGPDVTEVEWFLERTLVIPRLRIGKESAHAVVEVPKVTIPVDQPLDIAIGQLADGRHVGGLCVMKRHPDWKPAEQPKQYTLAVRVIDAANLHPISQATVAALRWAGRQFVEMERFYTDRLGAVYDTGRPSDGVEAIALDMPGWFAAPQCFRALPGENVNLLFRSPVVSSNDSISLARGRQAAQYRSPGRT